MISFMIANLDSVLFVMFALTGTILATKYGYKNQIKNMLLYLVLQAEERYGDGTGEVKYSAVVTWVYEKLPSLVKLLFTSKQIEKLINSSVVYMKEYLKENTKAKINILGGE